MIQCFRLTESPKWVVQGLAFRAQGLGFRAQGLGFWAQGLGFRDQGPGRPSLQGWSDHK